MRWLTLRSMHSLIDGGETPATIQVYHLRGGSEPVRSLSDPSVVKGIGVAVDSHHNLFWSNTTQLWSGGQVIEFHNGKMPGVLLSGTEIGSDTPGGVLTDSSRNLLLVDQNASAIYVYTPPYDAPPFATIVLKGTAVYCALRANQKRLYCLDYEYGSVDVYSYPQGQYLYSYTDGIDSNQDPIGIAIQSI